MRALLARAVRVAGHEIVAESCDGEAVLSEVARTMPDALFIDGRIPPSGVLAVIPRVAAALPTLKIYVVASLAERTLLRTAITAGAHGACLRPVRQSAIIELLNLTSEI
jgi:DNA-binding NarL/FixJ family response regulator